MHISTVMVSKMATGQTFLMPTNTVFRRAYLHLTLANGKGQVKLIHILTAKFVDLLVLFMYLSFVNVELNSLNNFMFNGALRQKLISFILYCPLISNIISYNKKEQLTYGEMQHDSVLSNFSQSNCQ